jgi:hypothetical protein
LSYSGFEVEAGHEYLVAFLTAMYALSDASTYSTTHRLFNLTVIPLHPSRVLHKSRIPLAIF